MANQYVGTGILFGLGDVTCTLSGFSNFDLLQSAEVTSEADQELVKNSSGVTKAVATYDERRKAVLEFIPASGSNAGTLVATQVPSLGTSITITSALSPVGDVWIFDGWTQTRTNTNALRMRINLSAYIEGAIP